MLILRIYLWFYPYYIHRYFYTLRLYCNIIITFELFLINYFFYLILHFTADYCGAPVRKNLKLYHSKNGRTKNERIALIAHLQRPSNHNFFSLANRSAWPGPRVNNINIYVTPTSSFQNVSNEVIFL